MYTIRIDINDMLYDKVIRLLKELPVKQIVIEKKDESNSKPKGNIVDFFQSSPLVGEIDIKRDKEYYSERVEF